MDPGLGVTMNETEFIEANDTIYSGYISLATTPVARFETYEKGFYYTQWHIKADVIKRILVTGIYRAHDNEKDDRLEFYDGPWEKNNLLEYYYYKATLHGMNQTVGVRTKGFQVIQRQQQQQQQQ